MPMPTERLTTKAVAIWTTGNTQPDRYELPGASFQMADEGIVVQKKGRTFLYPWFSITKVALES